MAAGGDVELKDLEQQILEEFDPGDDECRIEVPLAQTDNRETTPDKDKQEDESQNRDEQPRFPVLV